MKVAVRFVIVWGEHSLGSQLWWYFSPFVDISGVQMLAVLTALHFLVCIFTLFEACRSKRRACLPANIGLSEGKGASDRMYRECIFLANSDPSLHCCARSSLTHSDAATEGVGGQLYLNSIRTRQMNGSMAARLWGRAIVTSEPDGLTIGISLRRKYTPCWFITSNLGKSVFIWSHLPLWVCLLLRLCSLDLFLSQRILHCFHLCVDKSDTLSDSNVGHRTPAPPSPDPVELSGNLEQVMRISPCGRETVVRCPGGSCSDQCSLIFLCGTWMCFLRGWGSADPSAACLCGSNIHSFLSLDPAAVLVCLSVCTGSNPATS